MKRLSDNAIEIVNELHTERLSYDSEYVPIIDALNSLAAYEDTGLEPEEIQEAVDLFKDWRNADIPKELKSWVERCIWHVRKEGFVDVELDEVITEGVTHWMPPPEPPKEETNNEM